MSFCSQKRAVNEPVLHGTGPIWIAVLWRASFRLATGTPVQPNIAARTLDAPTERFLRQGQLKARPTIQAMAYSTIAYLVQTQ
jgi:hypothetical protein